MKCKDLFKNSIVEFIPVEDNLQRQESQITTYANYHGIKIKMEIGLWVNAATATAERILKLTLMGVDNKPRYPSRYKINEDTKIKREEKIKRITEYRKQGLTLQEIAQKENCTKQAISIFIKYHNIGDVI